MSSTAKPVVTSNDAIRALENHSYLRTPTWEGWLYVAFVSDVYGRAIVGWQIADHPRPASFATPWRWRFGGGTSLEGTSTTTTQAASPYTSIRYSDRLAEIDIAASIGSVGDSYDNAMVRR